MSEPVKDLKKELSAFTRKAKRIVARIAKSRDELRDLVYEYTSILESADEAHDCFEDGLDRLSQYL